MTVVCMAMMTVGCPLIGLYTWPESGSRIPHANNN
jgi:hypothetical protein